MGTYCTFRTAVGLRLCTSTPASAKRDAVRERMGENNYGSLEDWNGGNRAREIRHVGFENEMVEYIIRGISLP